jgi:hypothetical protein
VSLLASISLAEARESTLNMTCNQAAALVAARGAVVLSTGKYTFERFVATDSYCMLGEYGVRAWAPTRDGKCRLGFRCQHGRPPWEEMFDH